MKTSVVITSIYPLGKVITDIAKGCKENEWDFIVAGDSMSHDLSGVDNLYFFDVNKQLASEFTYAQIAPLKNYCRKNAAYLWAMKNGSERILETDDDNFPMESFFKPMDRHLDTKVVEQSGWVNVYRYFTENQYIWPRGFSLSDVKRKIESFDDLKSEKLYCPVQNGLVDNDPDIDAIYRLLFEIPFNFEHTDRKVAFTKGSWCSFNTQNTLFYKEMFPLMYQPATPQFREADILRSLVCQRILWENDAHLLFHSPTVWQERNEHDLMDDLKQETRLYAHVKDVSCDLEKLNIKSGSQNFHDNMIKCYEVYQKYGLVERLEFQLIDAWYKDIYNIGGVL